MNKEHTSEFSNYFHESKDRNLVIAIESGDDVSVRSAIDLGGDLNANGDYGKTPLMIAILANNQRIFDLLLKKGADPNHCTPGGVTCVVEAMRSKDDFFFNKLVSSGLNPCLVHDEIPIIIHAILLGKDACYIELVEKGADLSSKTNNGKTVASYLATADSYDLLKNLIIRGGDFRGGYGVGRVTPAQQLIEMQLRFSGDPEGEPFRKRAELLQMMRERGVKIPDGVPGV